MYTGKPFDYEVKDGVATVHGSNALKMDRDVRHYEIEVEAKRLDAARLTIHAIVTQHKINPTNQRKTFDDAANKKGFQTTAIARPTKLIIQTMVSIQPNRSRCKRRETRVRNNSNLGSIAERSL